MNKKLSMYSRLKSDTKIANRVNKRQFKIIIIID